VRCLILCFCCGMMLWLPPHTLAAAPDPATQQAERKIRRDFEIVLDLWRDGRYDELYERTYASGKHSRESFTRRIAAAGRKPACCWEKLQDVSVSPGQTGKATLHARIGLENSRGATEYCTRSFRMINDGETWKPARSEILSLAGKAAAKSSVYRYP